MALNGKHEFIIQNTKEKIFNFYLNEKEEISCISSNHQRQWINKEDIFPKRCSSLDINLDKKDRFHIVSYHYDGDLYYHHNHREQWKNIQLTSLKRNERVFYPRIKSIDEKIHIFYDLQQTDVKDRCTLFHFTYDDKEMTWKKSNVCTMKFNRFVNPYKVLIHKKQILLLYVSLINNNEEIFMLQYDSTNDQWSKPQQLTSTKDRKLYLDALMKDGNLHLTWCQYQDQEGMVVNYLKLNPKQVNLKEQPIQSLSQRLNCSFPQLVSFNNQLLCMWVQFNHLCVSRSLDAGDNWSDATVVSESKSNNFKRYRYENNQSKDKLDLKCDFLYGTHYPNIQFLGFGGVEHDEVPTSES